MAYDDTKWGGFAKIIVDTSTLTAGDTVRVRSMTDANAIYDKTVVTAGTPLLFETEIFKDYVKICKVQEIGGVATEIAGVYKTVDYGQTLFINVFDKTSLAGIQGILNAHQENDVFSIGDEITITVNNADWTMQVGGIDIYDTHEIILVSKYLYDNYYWNTGTSGKPKYSQTPLPTQCNSFFLAINATERDLIKDKTVNACYNNGGLDTNDYKVWLPTITEVFGGSGDIDGTPRTPELGLNSQFPIFTTANDRIRKYNNTAAQWFTATQRSDNAVRYWDLVTSTGGADCRSFDSMTAGILPCFHLTADA